jgi:hypothetical protein
MGRAPAVLLKKIMATEEENRLGVALARWGSVPFASSIKGRNMRTIGGRIHIGGNHGCLGVMSCSQLKNKQVRVATVRARACSGNQLLQLNQCNSVLTFTN